jgi:hypothetical protein
LKNKNLTCCCLILIGVIFLDACSGRDAPEPKQPPLVTPTLTPYYYDVTVRTPAAGEAAYVDPYGWYTFNYPKEWKPGDELNRLSGKDGFVESGYLPETMFLRNIWDACFWLAIG